MKETLKKALMILLVVIMALSSVPVTNIADLDISSPFAITAEAAKATIKFKKSKPTVYTGKKYTLKLLDKKGKTISASKIKWTTADKKIATVDKKGVVKGVKAGKVKITATYKKKKYVATVTVKASYKLNKTKVSVDSGKTCTLKLVDKNGKKIANNKVIWSTDNKKIATVSKKGVVTGKKAGKTKIYVEYKGKKYACQVKVKNKDVPVNTLKLSDVLSEPIDSMDDIRRFVSYYYAQNCYLGGNFRLIFNSVNGVILSWGATNKSDKTIKYITFTINYYNRVDDPAYDSITGKSSHTVRLTGPIGAGKSFYLRNLIGYGDDIYYGVISNVTVEFMDGTTASGNYGQTTWHNIRTSNSPRECFIIEE